MNPPSTECETTSVIICGGGPTGALLSAILGQMEVANIVLEREADITTDPRGIALDEDGIRMLQSIGLHDKIFTEIGSCMRKFNFITGTEHDLMKKPLIAVDQTTSDGGSGHPGFICHKQPVLERCIRDVIEQSPFAELRSSSTVTSISEDSDSVHVEYTDSTGSIRRLQAPFLVGADGKTGFVRKKYLEPRGVILQHCEGASYEETWVALNWHMILPTPKTHPTFPLWACGYTPEQVYDLFFPIEFRFLCNPTRPAVCGRFGLDEDRLWRFEFVVKEGEDGYEMAKSENTSKIIFPYLTHPGSRYGLSQSVQYPPDCIKTLRSRPFSFSARSCNKWAQGRVILVGDAAHVFPPFGGQGIASGMRDVSGLAWRLALLAQNSDIDYESLLTAWYAERKQQFERSLIATVRNGEYVTESDPIKVLIREWYLWAVQLIPSWKRELERGPRAEGMTRYKYRPGFAFTPDYGGGLHLPQVYAVKLDDGKVTFTDDILFESWKRGILQLLIIVDTPKQAIQALEEIKHVGCPSLGRISMKEATVLIHTHDVDGTANIHHRSVARIASAEEFAADTRLCKNRPPPIYYDPFRIQMEVGKGKRYVLVRPDRFVYAACTGLEELKAALTKLAAILHHRGTN